MYCQFVMIENEPAQYPVILSVSVWFYSSKLLQELRQEAACCLGLLCATLSYEAERIFKWMFLKFSVSTKDEVKLLYLVAVHKALETAGEKKAFSAVMQVPTQLELLLKYTCKIICFSG